MLGMDMGLSLTPKSSPTVVVVGGGGPSMAWSTTDNSGNVTISGGGLTATTTLAGSGVATTRGDRAATPDLAYWEVTPSSAFVLIGVCDATAPLSTSQFWGPSAFGYVATSHGAGYYGADSDIVYNDGFVSVVGFVGGDNIDIAVARTAKKAWWRKNNGSWLPSGDPAAGTGGQDIALIDSTMYPVLQAAANGAQSGTARFTSGTFINTPPTGFAQP
jgi:hypothetical protein